MAVERSILRGVRESGLFENNDRVVIGVSGGVDSVVLTDVLSRLSGEMNITSYIAHVNYGLRGGESDRDESFVMSLAKKYGTRLFIKKAAPILRPAKNRPGTKAGTAKTFNIQNLAREIRYDFLVDVAKKVGAGKLALAHHADDQAETVLLHLVRGAGPAGLLGMDRSRRMGAVKVIRPLLPFTKKEILGYAKRNGLRFVTDSTNLTNKYSRNFIRNEILPLLAAHNPNVVQHICRTAMLLRDEDLALNDITLGYFNVLCHVQEGAAAFSRDGFTALPVAIRRRLLRLIYGYLTGSSADLLNDHVERMLQIIDSSAKTGRYSLPMNVKFSRNADKILIRT